MFKSIDDDKKIKKKIAQNSVPIANCFISKKKVTAKKGVKKIKQNLMFNTESSFKIEKDKYDEITLQKAILKVIWGQVKDVMS